ncbi:MAG: polysaccharide pyruvyl transferase family protein [Thermodesulfobacteriota bacterium]
MLIHQKKIEENRKKLLDLLEGSSDITFIRGLGNIGDRLIYAGTRQLLSNHNYKEISVLKLSGINGHTALISGSGSWCKVHHGMPKFLPIIEELFERVIILPSSFDTSVELVKHALLNTKAIVLAREEVSYQQIHNICRADIAYDCAFYFDYRPYKRQGTGILNAFRTDRESAMQELPPDNNDISLSCSSLDEWLWTIARHDIVRTDRAHVAIAAALIGKRVYYRSSNYHKVPAIVDFSLKEYSVSPAIDDTGLESAVPNVWEKQILELKSYIKSYIPPHRIFILVDGEDLKVELGLGDNALPFLEKDGIYWGPPPDSITAIRELERLRETGVVAIVFAWPSFWWLDYYLEFHEYLKSRYECILKNDGVVIFDLEKQIFQKVN